MQPFKTKFKGLCDEGSFAKGERGGGSRCLPKGWISKGNHFCSGWGEGSTANGRSVATNITAGGVVVVSMDLARSSALAAALLLLFQQAERTRSRPILAKVPSDIAATVAG